MKWVCPVCGYVHEGPEPPEKCPVCKVPGSKFIKQEGEMTWAAEHVIGVAKDVPEEIKAGLRANFEGECTEVGMYLAMGRAAAREGYPEIAEYWKTAAFEEAETSASAWKPRTAPPRVRLTWPRRPRNWAWMPSMTPCMKWPATKRDMERPSKACWKGISANNNGIYGRAGQKSCPVFLPVQ